MPIILADLLEDLPVVSTKGDLNRPITGLVIDSRRVLAGSLFFALPGQRTDGHGFIDEAIARGCSAIVTGRPVAIAHPRVTLVQVSEPRAALAAVARRYHDYPDRALGVIGVTGTNGKTTTTHLCRYFLSSEGPVGLLGTITYDLGIRTVPSFKTTPEALDVFGMLAQMRAASVRNVAMEVSSHALAQQRVRGLAFAVGTFLNLTRDHLDYHGSLENYFLTKARLFDGTNGEPLRQAVINIDDAYGVRLRSMVAAGTPVLTFGLDGAADVRATDLLLRAEGTAFTVHWPGGRRSVTSPLVGAYNVSNVLAATASCLALGADPAAFLPRLAQFPGVPGRMQAVREGQPFGVFVDYAHTDDALRNALGMLRAVTTGRLLVVFGCGGNRDRTKRPLMTAAVQEKADLAWATADNPRSEPLDQIFADMRAGVTDESRMRFVEDRREAISMALGTAAAGDAVLIAGKGHETFQEFSGTVVPFDDVQVSKELLAVKTLARGTRRPISHA